MTTLAGDLDTLDADEPLDRRRRRHWYDRLMMLSDGVFAIAITIMAAEIRLPADLAGDWSGLWSQLAWQLDAYAVSALVIAIFWLAHRRFMAMILTADAPLTVINLLALALIALVPAATRLISIAGGHPAAKAIYGGLVVAIGLCLAALWGYASFVARLVSAEVSRRLRWFFLILILVTPPWFLLLTVFIPDPRRGVIPLVLASLFLVGWRMRLWTARRLGGAG